MGFCFFFSPLLPQLNPPHILSDRKLSENILVFWHLNTLCVTLLLSSPSVGTLLLQTSKGCGSIYYRIYFWYRSSKDSEKCLCAEGVKEKCNYSCLICLFQKLDTSHCYAIVIFLGTRLDSNPICWRWCNCRRIGELPPHWRFGKQQQESGL